jgi:hypothetical protein
MGPQESIQEGLGIECQTIGRARNIDELSGPNSQGIELQSPVCE